MVRTPCAVDAAAGAGSTERLESFLDPRSNNLRALLAPSVLQLVQAQLNVSCLFSTRVRITDVNYLRR